MADKQGIDEGIDEGKRSVSKRFIADYAKLCMLYKRFLYGDDSGMYVGETDGFDCVIDQYVELRETIV
jgi:hypothetical protein